MTLSEFKAWFDGYTEGIETAPTADQFARIKARLAEIDNTPTTRTIFLDRYVKTRPDWWPARDVAWLKGESTKGAVEEVSFADVKPEGHGAFRALGRLEASL